MTDEAEKSAVVAGDVSINERNVVRVSRGRSRDFVYVRWWFQPHTGELRPSHGMRIPMRAVPTLLRTITEAGK